jgi:hypothetical protein
VTPSNAKVIAVKVLVVDVGHGACAKAIGVISSETSNATTAKAAQVSSTKAAHVASAKATHVASTKATHVASAKATHVASTKAAAHAATMSSAAATTAPGLCAGREQAPSERCARQNCYHSSFHDILHLDGRIFRHGSLSDVGVSRQSEHQSRDRMEMRVLSCHLQ